MNKRCLNEEKHNLLYVIARTQLKTKNLEESAICTLSSKFLSTESRHRVLLSFYKRNTKECILNTCQSLERNEDLK